MQHKLDKVIERLHIVIPAVVLTVSRRRLCLRLVSNVTFLCAWRWLSSFDRIAGICAQQNHHTALPSATFIPQKSKNKCWNPQKNKNVAIMC